MKNILHISDIHASNLPTKGMNEQRLKTLLNALLNDLKNLPTVDTVFITGDIALAGKADEYTAFKEMFLIPFLERTGLGLGRIVLVPGNHDSRRDAWKRTDLLMREQLITKPTNGLVEEILKEKISDPGCEWFSNYTNFRDEIESDSGKKNIFSNKFFAAYDLDGVGVGTINSAWLSHGDDQSKLMIGEWQFSEIFKAIKPYEQKILLLHHPLDWLQVLDKGQITDLVHTSGIKCLFFGHKHAFGMARESKFSEDSVLKLQAGKMDILCQDGNAGYALLSLHDENDFDSGELYFRKYDFKKEEFAPWIERASDGFLRYSLKDSIPFNSSVFSGVCQEKVKGLEYDLLCNVGLPADQQKKLTDIFVCPSLVVDNQAGQDGLDKKSQTKVEKKFSLDALTSTNDSLIIIGGENSGKSTLAKRLVINFLREQASNNFSHIVYYLDVKGKVFTKSRKLREYLLGFYTDDSDATTFRSKIERALETSSPIIVVDSVESLDRPSLKILFEFVGAHPKARFILCGQLAARQVLSEFSALLEDKKRFKYLTVSGLKRSHVRELFGKWVLSEQGNGTGIVKNALRAVSGAGMPNNPFVYTMLLSIRERKATTFRSFMHEADLVENFIEIIMQKHVFSAENTAQYKDLLLFLGFIASNMHQTAVYSVSETDLAKAVVSFNSQISQDFSYSGYVNPILTSGIIKKEGGRYAFSQVCFFNYVFANWICKQSIDYEELDNRLDFLRFDKVVEYVSAIKKSDLSLLEYISKKTAKAWDTLLVEEKIDDLRDVETEMISCISHDIIDLVKKESLESELVEQHSTEEEIDDALDDSSPLTDTPVCAVKETRGKIPATVEFHETLSLYARAFRAAEHIMDSEATMRHFTNAYGHYMNSIAHHVRVFDKKLRPLALQKILKAIDYDGLDGQSKKQAHSQINAFINFTIAAVPNWTVAMMNSDFFNQRQKPRIEKYRDAETTANLGKILLTYCLCELDGVNVVREIQSQKYLKPHESSSLLIKIIELIMFNFSISGEEKKALDKFARKVLADRKTGQLFMNLNVISQRIAESNDLDVLVVDAAQT